MRKFLSRTSFKVPEASRCQVVAYRPGQNAERTKSWLNSISERATDAESRAIVAQLQSLISYYNKSTTASELPVAKLKHFRKRVGRKSTGSTGEASSTLKAW